MKIRGAFVCFLLASALALSAQGPASDFQPDTVFRGSQLIGWLPLGDAKWKADNGEIVAASGAGGGWLIGSKPYQDIDFFSQKCGRAIPVVRCRPEMRPLWSSPNTS